MYKEVKNLVDGGLSKCIQRLSDGAFIPFNPELTEYQQYIKWLEEGNTPEPADEVQQ